MKKMKAPKGFRPIPSNDLARHEAKEDAYRILTNVLRIIESTPFAGAKTAALVLESYDYVQRLRGQLPRPANAPFEAEGPLLERVQNEIAKEDGIVTSGTETVVENGPNDQEAPAAE